MTAEVPLVVGAVAIAAWGIAHVVATRPIAAGFGPLSVANRRIITMEAAAEGIVLVFVGVLVLVTTALGDHDAREAEIVYVTSAAALLVLAALSLATGARTPILPMKLCPAVKTAVALLFLLGALA
jgi:hypothetical protein